VPLSIAGVEGIDRIVFSHGLILVDGASLRARDVATLEMNRIWGNTTIAHESTITHGRFSRGIFPFRLGKSRIHSAGNAMA
jgi:hypothetical protein